MEIKEYKEFLDTYENKKDYFECHEILEELWIKETNCETKKHPSVILLQIAVGAYHWKNKNIIGAKKLFQGVLENYPEVAVEINNIGFDEKKLKKLVEEQLDKINLGKEFAHFSLPLK
ncbi:DUF309 domain-containing protein [Cetobacterium sp. SF1]|uniref:DUF309 domain-containing protein n=1 Tax=Cetobacterium sp. SF1 TaxID=3417654 RepID=UPI003CEA0B7C